MFICIWTELAWMAHLVIHSVGVSICWISRRCTWHIRDLPHQAVVFKPARLTTATQDNIYLSLDGTGVTEVLLRGGGIAKCRYGIDDGAMETFHKEVEPDEQFAFRSTTFNNVYLRVDHWQVKTPGDRGTVNVQFGKFTLETS